MCHEISLQAQYPEGHRGTKKVYLKNPYDLKPILPFLGFGSGLWMPEVGSVKSRHSKCPSKHMLLPHGLKQTNNLI